MPAQTRPHLRQTQVTAATSRTGNTLITGHRRYAMRRTTALRVTFTTGERLNTHHHTTPAPLRPTPMALPSRAEIIAQILAGCTLVLTLTLAVVLP